MSWNYRIVKYRDGSFGLHEVYYDADGKPRSMTEKPAEFTAWDSEGPQGIRKSLLMASADARKRPVLDEADTWPEYN